MARIYIIRNDINDKVYIGKTEFSLEKRFREHCSDANKRRCEKRPLYNAMRKYGTQHFSIELIEETDKPEEREIFWIQQYGSYVNGYNATLGGDSKKYIDYDEVVRVYSEVQNCVKVAEIMGISVDSVRDILAARCVKVASSQDVNKALHGKMVCMMTSDGSILKTFDSLTSASQFVASLSPSRNNTSGIKEHIKGVCTGKRKSAYGYLWQFTEVA